MVRSVWPSGVRHVPERVHVPPTSLNCTRPSDRSASHSSLDDENQKPPAEPPVRNGRKAVVVTGVDGKPPAAPPMRVR
jgi:hypothetical protein